MSSNSVIIMCDCGTEFEGHIFDTQCSGCDAFDAECQAMIDEESAAEEYYKQEDYMEDYMEYKHKYS